MPFLGEDYIYWYMLTVHGFQKATYLWCSYYDVDLWISSGREQKQIHSFKSIQSLHEQFAMESSTQS